MLMRHENSVIEFGEKQETTERGEQRRDIGIAKSRVPEELKMGEFILQL